MKKLFFLGCLFLLPLVVAAEPYYSLDSVCIVEKKGNGYWFLNDKEFRNKIDQIVGPQRNSFEWFFTDGTVEKDANGFPLKKPKAIRDQEKIVAKVNPMLRDAIIQAPEKLYIQKLYECGNTDENQKLAVSVSFRYTSKNRVCGCLFEVGRINCHVSKEQLKRMPTEKKVLFFQSEGAFPLGGFINGIMPTVFTNIVDNLSGYQNVDLCSNNTSNEEIIKQMEPLVRNLKR